ncbi:MAG TPA: phophatidylserine decarboxylase associated domain-containing protein [Candidatus Acidoferrales bacterium]|nr:phophatidylserine decarboxylase associated domain-containing protein [Candidatus Acidoferrales bacterium]HEV3483399.1 phophatidylserine decarboxylase associated domain-containing protein [Candidatus Acidoferrales bacterium]
MSVRLGDTWRISVLGVVLSLVVLPSGTGNQAPKQSTRHVPVVEDLVQLLHARTELRAALEGAIRKADLKGLRDMDSFLTYLDGFVTYVPTGHEQPTALKLHYIVNQAPGDQLNRDKSFSAWMRKLVEAWGQFLDTPASAAGIPAYTALPNYHIDDYFVEPSGWLTFNQFFAREVKPGKRPIAEPRNDKVIVSPADSVFAGKWDIDANSKVTVKGVTWQIAKLLDGSSYQDAFENGIYTHSFLNSDDYHRCHVPVAGEIKEVRKIQGRVYLNLVRRADGSLQIIDGDTYQYNQERGLIVIDSPEVGLVAVLPIGMGDVSSVNLTPEVGARLQKGDEFGFFMFGGSDIVMLFQNKKVVIDAEVGRKYLQGQRIGEVR